MKISEHDYKDLMRMLFRRFREMIDKNYLEVEGWDPMEMYDQMIFEVQRQVWDEKTIKEIIEKADEE
jgi:hypothetical protein